MIQRSWVRTPGMSSQTLTKNMKYIPLLLTRYNNEGRNLIDFLKCSEVLWLCVHVMVISQIVFEVVTAKIG